MRQGVENLLATEILVPLYNSKFLLSAADGEFNLHQNSESCVARFSSKDLSAARIQPTDQKRISAPSQTVPFNTFYLILLALSPFS